MERRADIALHCFQLSDGQDENVESIAEVVANRMAEQRAQNAARLREVLAGD
jgi:hypothetical protein